jgi:hypothetical protein
MDAVDVLGRQDGVGDRRERVSSAALVEAGSSTTRVGTPTSSDVRRIWLTYTLDARWLPTLTAARTGRNP